MSITWPWQVAVLIVSVVLFALAVIIWPDRGSPSRVPARDLVLRVAREDGMEPAVWPQGWPHEAPDRPFNAFEARLVMRRHSDCTRENCPRKRAAWKALPAADRQSYARRAAG